MQLTTSHGRSIRVSVTAGFGRGLPPVPAGPSCRGERIYEPITLQIDRDYGDGTYRPRNINFIGRLVRLIENGCTTMRLYEWVDRGYVVYLVHVQEKKPGRPPRRTLYPFANTHSARATPKKGYTAEEVSQAYPEFANTPGVRQGGRHHTRIR